MPLSSRQDSQVPQPSAPPPSTWALRTGVDLDHANLHLAELEAEGLLGITEEAGMATVWLPHRVGGLALYGTWEEVPHADWHADWQARLQPVEVAGLRIAPPWKTEPGDLVIEPAQAFGTGHHETTTGCLAALAALDLSGMAVLDVGTGTGLLAIAALRLGAAKAVGVDTDPLAIQACAHNATVNGVEVEALLGSTEAVDGTFDVVLANLTTDTHTAIAGDLVARLAPGGTLIASGASIERAPEAVTAFAAAGLPVHARPGAEWTVLVGTFPP